MAVSSSLSFKLSLGTALLLLSCGSNVETPAAEVERPAEDVPSKTVDLHGEWRRWAGTPKLREEALRRMESLPRFGFGRKATEAEITAIDIDVSPDGTGLPEGSGSVSKGASLYRNQCVQCHGADGRGADYDALAGADPQVVGNYWPYATTLYDYVYRAMPQAAPGTLPPNDIYSLVAYILYLNQLLPENGTLDRESLPRVEMPARDRFVYDDREGGPEVR